MKKRILSLCLCSALIVSCLPVPRAAADGGAYTFTGGERPLIVVAGMDFTGLVADIGTENERPAIESITTKGILKTVLVAGGAGIVNGSFDAVVDKGVDYARSLLGNIACDNTGASIYPVSVHKYPNAISTHANLNLGNDNESGIAKRAAELYGGENAYFVIYDWRTNPLDVADEIAAAVDDAIATTGYSKVNLVCTSMGGVMTVGYLTKYGYDKLNKCVFVSSTFHGTQVVTDLFRGEVEIDSDALYRFVDVNLGQNAFLSGMFKTLKSLGVFKMLSTVANGFIDRYKQTVFDDLLKDCFGYILPFWALVQPEEYDACINFMFSGREEENAAFIAKTRQLQAMMANRDALLNEAVENGVQISVIASYNFPLIPVYPGASLYGDGTLETKYMSGGATIANHGETLGEDIINSGSEYLSSDGAIDASTCVFPQSTWLIKDSPHIGCRFGSEQSDFLFWILAFDGQAKVTSNPAYPQFMQSDGAQSLAPLS